MRSSRSWASRSSWWSSALEALLGLCVGCVLFQLMRLGVVPEEICLDCADITRRAQARASS